MFARRSFAVPLLLAIGVGTCTSHSEQAFAEDRIRVGDHVVTIRPAELKRATTTLATIEAGTELVAKNVKGDWIGFDVQGDGGATNGWIHVRNLRRVHIGTAVTSPEEFRKTLDAMLRASREAIGADEKQYQPAPYVAFSLRVARRQIEKAGDDFRSTDPDVWRMAGINKVRGFVYDAENGDLILVGAIEPDRAPLTLDDLVVALRARLRYGEWPLVSIDPTPDTEKTELQNVRFEGGIRDTAFGLDLLAADYELKGMALGFVEGGITDFASCWDLTEAADQRTPLQQKNVSARLWFYPINSDVKVREGVCAIEGLTVGVFTEVLSVTIDGKPVENLKGYKDASNDAFAEQVSRRFAELARNHYAFRRLHGLEELVGLSKALEQLQPRPELSWWLQEYRLLEVASPKQLPVARRRSQDARRGAEMSGGVHLTALALRLNRGNVSALREAVLTTRPRSEALSWAFSVGKWVIPLGPGQVNPDDIALLYAQALALAELKRYSDSITLFKRVLEAKPDSPDVWNDKGEVLRRCGRFDESIQCFDRAIQLNNKDFEAWNNKGIALGALGRHNESLQCLNHAIELNAKDAPAWTNKGNLLAEMARYKEAVECHDLALQLRPDFAEAWYSKGNTLVKLGALDDAISCYNHALEANRCFAQAYGNRGATYYFCEKYDQAIADFGEALALDPRYEDAFNNRGRAYSAKEEYDLAIADYNKAIELDRTDAIAYCNRAEAWFHKRRYEKALMDIQLCRKHGGKPPPWLEKTIRILVR